MQQAAEIVEVLPGERLVQAVVRLEVAQDLLRHGLLRRERPARHEPQHEKRGGDDEVQREQGLQQARRDETQHGGPVGVKGRVKVKGQ